MSRAGRAGRSGRLGRIGRGVARRVQDAFATLKQAISQKAHDDSAVNKTESVNRPDGGNDGVDPQQ